MGTESVEAGIESGGQMVAVRVQSAPAQFPPGQRNHQAPPLVLHLRGGAFQPGTSDCGRRVATLLAEAGAVVVSPDYPAGCEHPFPEALELAYGVLTRLYKERSRWARKASRLFVAGEDAGGNLAAALAMLARDRLGPPLAGQILLSPMLDAGLATCSVRATEAQSPCCRRLADGWHDYLGSPEKASHPYAAPASASRLGGLAPALVLTAEDDPMRDESLTYAHRLRESGVAVQEHVLPAPTRWPEALGQLELPEPVWSGAVRDALVEFFHTATQQITTQAAAPARQSL